MINALKYSDTKVKECPYCRSDKVLLHEYAPESWVECIKCGAHTKMFSFLQNAVAEWNVGNVKEAEE